MSVATASSVDQRNAGGVAGSDVTEGIRAALRRRWPAVSFDVALDEGSLACLSLRWEDGPGEWAVSRLARALDAPAYVHLTRSITPAVFAQAVLCDLHLDGCCSDPDAPLFGCGHPAEREEGSRDVEDLLLHLTHGELPVRQDALFELGLCERDASLLAVRARALVDMSYVEHSHLASRNVPDTSETVLRWLRLRFGEVGGLDGLDRAVTGGWHDRSGPTIGAESSGGA